MMIELKENKSSHNNIKENKNIRIIRGITPITIKKCPNKELIRLMNKEQLFLDYIDIKALELFDKEVINCISTKIIFQLTQEQLEKLARAGKIQFLKTDFLNHIKVTILIKLPDYFFNQIDIIQFKKAEEKIVFELLKNRKIHNLKISVMKYFYKTYFNSIKEIEDIKYLLSNSGKNFEYLTPDNFIYLISKFIGKTNELDSFFEDLKNYVYPDENNGVIINYGKGVLDFKEFIKSDIMVVKYEEIKERIKNFLDNSERYELLKDYCIKCLDNKYNKELAFNTLNEILKEPAYNIFKKIEQYRINEILILIDNDRRNQIKYYIRLHKILREVNSLILVHPCEFDAKINFFSHIINERLFNIDFLENLAEENYSNIESVINEFYNGSDKNAIPEELRKQYVKIIKDYLEIVKRKYKINEDLFIEKLQKIAEDKENINIKLEIFLQTINDPEKLYFDLLKLSILEGPSTEKNVEAKISVLFKYLRDIGCTLAGLKCLSHTGIKILPVIGAGIGASIILKNIKNDIIKSYFSLSENQKRLFTMNYRNIPQKPGDIISRKIKENFRKVITTGKKYTDAFLNNILKKKDEAKIGFDKFNFDFKNTQKVLEECISFRNNIIDLYINTRLSMIEPQYNQKLYCIDKKIEKETKKKKSKKMKEFSNKKEKLVNYLINKRKAKLKEKFPDFNDDSFLNKSKKIFGSIGDFFKGAYNGIVGSIAFFADLRIKESKNDAIEKLIKGVKQMQYQEEFDKFKEYEEDCKMIIIKDTIKYFVKSSNDENILIYLEEEAKKSRLDLEKLKYKLKNDIMNNSIENDINEELINIQFDDNLDDKKEILLI